MFLLFYTMSKLYTWYYYRPRAAATAYYQTDRELICFRVMKNFFYWLHIYVYFDDSNLQLIFILVLNDVVSCNLVIKNSSYDNINNTILLNWCVDKIEATFLSEFTRP